MNKYDAVVLGSLDVAQSELLKRNNSELTHYHLLFGLVQNPTSFLSQKIKDQKNWIKNKLDQLPSIKGKINLENVRPSTSLSEWLTQASSHATQRGSQEISERDLVRYMPNVFPDLDIDYSDLNSTDENIEVPSFLINLNELAEQGKLDPVIGRTKEIRAVMEILGRRGKNNPVLVGEAGVGKTAIIEGLAEAIIKGNVPDVLKDKIVMSLEMGSLMAGTKYRGEFEERMQSLIKYVKSRAGEVILFIDEIHQLVGAGRTDGAMDAANLLKPALARGELHCIGATTPNEYQKYILGDSALDRRFRSVIVREPSTEDAIEILMGVKEKMEIHHGIKISDEAIFQSVLLSNQYITNKYLPDKAIDLIDEASSALKLSAEAMPANLSELEAEIRSKKIYAQIHKDDANILNEISKLEDRFLVGKKEWDKSVLALKRVSELKNQLDRYKFDLDVAQRKQSYEEASRLKYSIIPEIEKELGKLAHDWVLRTKDIAMVIARQTGIPLEKILKSKQDHILGLEKFLNGQVYGQTSALKEIAQTLITSYAGLTDHKRPLGSFLLKGPSGVGKTETAKAIARYLFEQEKNIIRLDMSEYSEKHSVAKLIGSPAGYIGYEEGGILTEAVRKMPYAIILFDEIEKAHSDFSDILLQILDDGRLTDNKGRTIDFKNTIIFLTTNSKDIEHDFKPEVIGRIDAVLEYHLLDESIMNQLVDKQLQELNQKLKEKKITIEMTSSARKYLAEIGYDPRYGARPLQSQFNRHVIRPLAASILAGNIEDKKMVVDFDKSTFTIK